LAGSSSPVVAGAVLLNVPQRPLLQIIRQSGPPFSSSYSPPLYAPASFGIMKLYVYYEDAWWRNDLGLHAGMFNNTNFTAPKSHVIHMHEIPPQSPAPLQGQYHDGDVRCDGPGGKCRGYLQAFYSGGAPMDFYTPFHSWDGDAVVHLDPASAEHKELLRQIHNSLVELHAPALKAANAMEKVASQAPVSGVLSMWTEGVTGIHSGCHSPKPGTNPRPEDLPKMALQPFAGEAVFVANEAYGPVPCFAEGSLNMSMAALERIGVPLPSWLEPSEAPHPPPRMDPFLFMSTSYVSSSSRSEQLVV